MTPEALKEFLLEKAELYEVPDFIPDDPLSIPHRFEATLDIEVSGFLAATLAWGNRIAILKSLNALMERMDHAPGDFMLQHEPSDLAAFDGFVHRTFQADDMKGFAMALKSLLVEHGSLEALFSKAWQDSRDTTQLKEAIGLFHESFVRSPGVLPRTQKHVANPMKGSAAKRINLFLRWMVRPAARGVDLGLWSTIPPSVLSLPLDVHTAAVSRKLGLLDRKSNDWKAVEEITTALRAIDPGDPVRLDFALFGLGALEGF